MFEGCLRGFGLVFYSGGCIYWGFRVLVQVGLQVCIFDTWRSLWPVTVVYSRPHCLTLVFPRTHTY
jgi:hypothetical protein